MRISALRDPAFTGGRTYWLLPGEGSGSAGDLEFRSYKGIVDKALAARGYVPVPGDTQPHLVIFLQSGKGDGKVKSQTSLMFTPRSGGLTVVPPLIHTEFTSWVVLSAVDGADYVGGRGNREVWRTRAWTDDANDVMRDLFPYLIAAAMDHFGRGLSEDVEVLVPQASERAAWLSRGGAL